MIRARVSSDAMPRFGGQRSLESRGGADHDDAMKRRRYAMTPQLLNSWEANKPEEIANRRLSTLPIPTETARAVAYEKLTVKEKRRVPVPSWVSHATVDTSPVIQFAQLDSARTSQVTLASTPRVRVISDLNYAHSRRGSLKPHASPAAPPAPLLGGSTLRRSATMPSSHAPSQVPYPAPVSGSANSFRPTSAPRRNGTPSALYALHEGVAAASEGGRQNHHSRPAPPSDIRDSVATSGIRSSFASSISAADIREVRRVNLTPTTATYGPAPGMAEWERDGLTRRAITARAAATPVQRTAMRGGGGSGSLRAVAPAPAAQRVRDAGGPIRTPGASDRRRSDSTIASSTPHPAAASSSRLRVPGHLYPGAGASHVRINSVGGEIQPHLYSVYHDAVLSHRR